MTQTQTPRPNDKRRIFLNMKAPGCDRETVDEVRACDFETLAKHGPTPPHVKKRYNTWKDEALAA